MLMKLAGGFGRERRTGKERAEETAASFEDWGFESTLPGERGETTPASLWVSWIAHLVVS